MTSDQARPGRTGGRRPLSAAILLLGLAPVVGACGGSEAEGNGASATAQEAPRAAPASPDDSGTLNVTDLGFNRGAPDAPIRVIEFSDFGCGYCKKFHLETFPTLAEEYIETGKVAWKYIPFVLGMFPNAVQAAMAGECAGRQDSFGAYRDRLFEDQGEWKKSSRPYELFKEYAAEEGLDAERFARCVDERIPSERVRANIEAGRKVGVRGTPMFVINGFPVQGALPVDVFREIFSRVLEAEQSGETGS